jgi:hypothetical protein
MLRAIELGGVDIIDGEFDQNLIASGPSNHKGDSHTILKLIIESNSSLKNRR